jgi:uroporphyrinogen decarboxylase
MFRPKSRNPDFRNLMDVLEKKIPSRPVLFEFGFNDRLIEALTGEPMDWSIPLTSKIRLVRAYDAAGHDYGMVTGGLLRFPRPSISRGKTISLNAGSAIRDRVSFDAYPWPDADAVDLSDLERLRDYLPDGMKLTVRGPGGVLENAISLVGYDTLCLMVHDDEQLVHDIFEQIGTRICRYYERCLSYDTVGAVVSHDDWGFNHQTMLSPADMRRFVFPYHTRLVETAHSHGRPAILHSCGCYRDIMDDLVCGMRYDARHSYEDNITPVEMALEELRGKIAVLGGLDMDFMARASEDEVYRRSVKLLTRGMETGGFALGTGNGVADYIPDANYYAMARAAFSL